MKYDVIHVGDFKENYLSLAFEEYKKRISAFSKVEDIPIKEARLPDTPSDSEIERALAEEGQRILERIAARSRRVALCVEGKGMSSEELAAFVADAADGGFSRITFIIGSSHGLSEEVKRACDLRLSFSRMTFPHQLMRVILMEQIYRAETIIAGKKYHK